MEWKEHVAWLAPMIATSAAFLVAYYGRRLARESRVRRVAIVLFMLAFAPQPWRASSARSLPRSRRSNEEGGHDNYPSI
jgi:hypothetical protein